MACRRLAVQQALRGPVGGWSKGNRRGVGGVAAAHDDRVAVIHADGESPPVIPQVFRQRLIQDLREDMAELEGGQSGFLDVFAILVEVKHIALQFKQFEAEQAGRRDAGMGVFLNYAEIFPRGFVGLGDFKIFNRTVTGITALKRTGGQPASPFAAPPAADPGNGKKMVG